MLIILLEYICSETYLHSYLSYCLSNLIFVLIFVTYLFSYLSVLSLSPISFLILFLIFQLFEKTTRFMEIKFWVVEPRKIYDCYS